MKIQLFKLREAKLTIKAFSNIVIPRMTQFCTNTNLT